LAGNVSVPCYLPERGDYCSAGAERPHSPANAAGFVVMAHRPILGTQRLLLYSHRVWVIRLKQDVFTGRIHLVALLIKPDCFFGGSIHEMGAFWGVIGAILELDFGLFRWYTGYKTRHPPEPRAAAKRQGRSAGAMAGQAHRPRPEPRYAPQPTPHRKEGFYGAD